MPTRRGGVLKPMLIAVLVAVAVLMAWIGVEVYFAITARPKIDTDYASQMEALAASVQGDGPNRWNDFRALLAEHEAIDDEVVAQVRAIQPTNSQFAFSYDVVTDFESLEASIRDTDAEDFVVSDRATELARLEAGRAAYVNALESWDASGFTGRLRSMRESPGVYVRQMPREGMLIDVLLPELGEMRAVSRALRARAYLAAEAGEWDEYVATIADGLWIASVVESEPILISWLVGAAVRSSTLEGVRLDVIRRRLPPAVLGQMAELVASNPVRSAQHALRGELLWGLDAVQHSHDQRGRLLLSRLSVLEGEDMGLPPISNMASIAFPTRQATEQALRDRFALAIERSALTPAERRDSPPEAVPTGRSNPVVDLMMPALGRAFWAFDTAIVELIGLRTLIAIERYRAELGQPPATLDDLMPTYLDAVPLDPWSIEGPLVYRRDASELGYVLYSVGFDGEDSNATRPGDLDGTFWDQEALRGDYPDTDFVLSRPADR